MGSNLNPASGANAGDQSAPANQLASADTIKNPKEDFKGAKEDPQETDKPAAKDKEKTKAEELDEAFKKNLGLESNKMKGDGGLSCVSSGSKVIRESIDPDFPATHDTIEAAEYMLKHPEKYELIASGENMSSQQLVDAIHAAPEGTIIDMMRSPLKEETGKGSWGHFGEITKVQDSNTGEVKTMIISNQKVPGTRSYQIRYSDTPENWVYKRAVPRGLVSRNLLFKPKE